MKSSIYQVRMMDGTEKVVNELLDKYYKGKKQNKRHTVDSQTLDICHLLFG